MSFLTPTPYFPITSLGFAFVRTEELWGVGAGRKRVLKKNCTVFELATEGKKQLRDFSHGLRGFSERVRLVMNTTKTIRTSRKRQAEQFNEDYGNKTNIWIGI